MHFNGSSSQENMKEGRLHVSIIFFKQKAAFF